jgi:putative inorganic carbon (HCO3(-)) transporter
MNYLRLQSPHTLVRQGLVVAMACTVVAVLGTQSRGGLLALAATAGVLWLRTSGKVISGIALGILLAAAIGFMPDSWVQRMETIQAYDQDESANQRLGIWLIALQLTALRPLLGGGFLATYHQSVVDLVAPGIKARAVHSIWLEVLVEQGVPGFLLWTAMLGGGVLYTLRLARLAAGRDGLRWAYDLARMMQVSIVAYCVGGSFLSLSYWDVFWTLMVTIAATHRLARAAMAGREAGRVISAPQGRSIAPRPVPGTG